MENYFLTVCLNPTLQKTILLKGLFENEINRSEEYYLDVSGKGINVSRVLNQLGENVMHLTQTGGMYKDLFLSMALKEGITVETVESNSEIRFCYTLLNREKNTTTEIIEEARDVERGTEEMILDKFYQYIQDSHTLILSGTKAKGFSPFIFQEMVREAKNRHKLVVIDVKGEDLLNSIQYKPDIIKPNFEEFLMTFFPEIKFHEIKNEDIEKNTDVLNLTKQKMSELYKAYGIITVLTRGKDDVLFLEDGNITSMPVETITPVNTIGSGDAFTAGLASEYHAGKSINESVKKGINCASLNAVLVHPGVIR